MAAPKIEPDLNQNQLEGHINTHIEREYLGSYNLMKPDGTYTEVTVEIAGVFKRNVWNKTKNALDSKIVIKLKGKDKKLILNQVNRDTVSQIAGSEMAQKWVGVKLQLFVKKVRLGPDMVDAIRIKKPPVQAQTTT